MTAVELNILWAIHHALSCPALDTFFKGLTLLANGGRIWIALCLVLILFPKTRIAGVQIALSLALTSLVVNLGIKPVVGRTRPYTAAHFTTIVPHPSGTSFPSGHTAAAFATAWAFFLCFKKAHPGWCAWVLVLAGLVGFSRLYLFVHYPTDVLAGAGIGIVIAAIIYRLFVRSNAQPDTGRKIDLH